MNGRIGYGIGWVVVAVGCGGGLGSAVRPADIAAKDAVGSACKADAKSGQATPFIADWEDGDRASLEAAMKKGVAVVNYSCEGVKVLSACRAKGDYKYAAVSRKERVVEMKDAQSVAANLSIPTVPASFKSDMSQGRSLNLAYVMTGVRSTAVAKLTKADLEGACDGATHFIYDSSVGAFAMGTASEGSMRVAADVFKVGGAEAKGGGSKTAQVSDGDISACKSSTADDEKPVSGCEALVRLTLIPIGDANRVVRPGAVDARGCEPGFVYSGDACTKAGDAKTFLCDANNFRQCVEQCQKGDDGSCGRVGTYFIEAYSNVDVKSRLTDEESDFMEKNKASWLPRFIAACDAGEANACTAASWSTAGDKAKKAVFREKACLGGEGWACDDLEGVLTLDRYTKVLRTSCDRGAPLACTFLGELFLGLRQEGPVRIPSALEAFERGCTGGSFRACGSLAALTSEEARCFDFYAKYRKLGGGRDEARKFCPDPTRKVDAARSSAALKKACGLNLGGPFCGQ
jgi:hypothetical protein